jgi:D-alanyl-D-alanine carboxypeptidase/D-alanyl-D-alanine-endopeptidase (penicillin-binding protein 4)
MVPGSRYGLSIRSVKTGLELGNIRGVEKFTPASTLKTLTTATAIHYLPLNYAPQTEVSLNGSVQKRTFVGTVNIHGAGDPNFSGRYYADPFHMLYAMADSIHALGIDSIAGELALDTSYYAGPWRAEHWRKNFYDAWYGAEIAPLGFNDNCTMIRFKPGANVGDTAIAEILPDVGYVVLKNEMLTVPGKKRKWTWALDSAKPEITIGGAIGIGVDSSQLVLPVRNPIAYFKAAFIHALKERGVAFVERQNVPAGIQIKSFTYSAAPLLSILDEINQRSQNMHAETLFRNMGAQKTGKGSVESGRALEMKFLAEMGLDSTDFEVWDGCGLSPKNKVKPSTETALLAKMARHPKGRFYINSFAGPGLGTGGKRMLELPYPWLTRFKTGFIGEVHGLVGYIYALDGDTLAVAMYLNETGKNSDAQLKDVLDTLWTRLVLQANDSYASLMKMKQMWLSAQNVAGLAARLEYFSRMMKGIPYKLGPMGEGYIGTVDSKPIVYMDSVDCVTYLEHVLAMAIAPNENAIAPLLQKIRYKDGIIDYVHRKHYLLADWVSDSKFARVMQVPGDTVVKRTMPKQNFFKAKKIKYETPDAPMDLRYLPYNRAVEMASKPYAGPLMVTGVAFVASANDLDATHTGFVIFRNGELPKLRHAAWKKHVVELSLKDYLASRKGKLPGITLFEFLKQ